MQRKITDTLSSTRRNAQVGFTLIELSIAIVVLLLGLVAVAQLVPATIRLNLGNRNDTTALVYAQRELDQMAAWSLTSGIPFADSDGNCAALIPCSLGSAAGAANSVTFSGSPVVTVNNRLQIDYTAAPVATYRFLHTDTNDPTATAYDVRWAVYVTKNSAGVITAKRFILGVVRLGGNGPLQPVNLDVWVQQ